ncbi:MAG TPA: tRNA (uracil-5-)-methyltransferase [Candidatus Merdiplasma excrementigallinarum]|uniref:tRNA (Uracil-5-)-methyltransferase n=1 Tax=Candidatus Merdiplasma excrementigallinarum TaxID=2840864 RepID=A0A9D1NZS3_9FIRM|nr:tRNA (uracil-5-)-methyltransferase [Candidatus Merdiplasma excrementigallinarum]
MNKTTKTILLIVLAVILVGGGVFVGMNWNQWFGKEDAPVTADLDENAEDYTGDREVYQGEKNTDTIDIPGFEALNMKAGTTEQSVNLYNPEQNTCYFKMSLILADGTVLWESDLVALGKAIYDLTLTEALDAGEYALKYECFAMDEAQTPLNGSEIKLTLHVLE